MRQRHGSFFSGCRGLVLTACVILCGCQISSASTQRWQVALSASIGQETETTIFSFTNTPQTQSVLQLFAEVTPAGAGSVTAKASAVFGSIWAPAAVAPYVDEDLANPPLIDAAALATQSPGKGWILLSDFQQSGNGGSASTVPVSGTAGSQLPGLVHECVLVLTWNDAGGSWWSEKFGVGGRALGHVHTTKPLAL